MAVRQSLVGLWEFRPLAAIPEKMLEPPIDGWDSTPIRVPGYWNSFPPSVGGDWGAYDHYRYPAHWNDAPAAWYRYRFRAERSLARRAARADGLPPQTHLHFAAVAGHSTVWLNGVRLGENTDSFLPFAFDVSAVLRPDGDNELCVLVTPPPQTDAGLWLQPCGSWVGWNLRGIWQGVYLEQLPQPAIVDVFAQPSFRQQRLTLAVTLAPTAEPLDVKLAAVIADERGPALRLGTVEARTTPTGETVATLYATWPGVRCWSPEDPYRYHALVDLRIDGRTVHRRSIRFGFRELWIDGTRLLLNGRPIRLLGDSWHYMGVAQQNPAYARAWFDFAKETGVNAIRTHAMPYPPCYFDVADEMGMLLIDESAIYGSAGTLAYAEPRFWDACRDHVRRLVRRDRNHPSVVFWSACNETVWKGGAGIYPELLSLAEVARQEDPTRFVSFDENDCDLGGGARLHAGHYGTPEHWDRAWRRDRPLVLHEFSALYHGGPENACPFGGEEVYADYNARLEATGRDAADMFMRLRALGAVSITPWNLNWYCLTQLPGVEVLAAEAEPQASTDSLPFAGAGRGKVEPPADESWQAMPYAPVAPPIENLSFDRLGDRALTLNYGQLPDAPPWLPNAAYAPLAACYRRQCLFAPRLPRQGFAGETINIHTWVFNDTGTALTAEVAATVELTVLPSEQGGVVTPHPLREGLGEGSAATEDGSAAVAPDSSAISPHPALPIEGGGVVTPLPPRGGLGEGPAAAPATERIPLDPCQSAQPTLTVTLPAVAAHRVATLVLTLRDAQTHALLDAVRTPLHLHPRPDREPPSNVWVFGGAAEVLTLVRHCGWIPLADDVLHICFEDPTSTLVLAGPHEGRPLARWLEQPELDRWLRAGGRLVVLPEGVADDPASPLSPIRRSYERVHFRDARCPLLAGLTEDHLCDWGQDGVTARQVFERPTTGPALTPLEIADASAGLAYAPLVVAPRGAGAVIVTGLDLLPRLADTPAAGILLRQLATAPLQPAEQEQGHAPGSLLWVSGDQPAQLDAPQHSSDALRARLEAGGTVLIERLTPETVAAWSARLDLALDLVDDVCFNVARAAVDHPLLASLNNFDFCWVDRDEKQPIVQHTLRVEHPDAVTLLTTVATRWEGYQTAHEQHKAALMSRRMEHFAGPRAAAVVIPHGRGRIVLSQLCLHEAHGRFHSRAQRIRARWLAALGAPIDDATSPLAPRPATPLRADGYVGAWLILGPFAEAPSHPLDHAFVDEAALQPRPGATAGGHAWRPFTSAFQHNDLSGFFGDLPPRDRVAYAAVYLHAAQDRSVLLDAPDMLALLVGSDGGNAVWLNGQRVGRHDFVRELVLDNDRVENLPLRQGWNLLVLKLHNHSGAWRFSARLATSTGGVASDLHAQTAPPG